MTSDSYRRDVERHRKEIASLQDKKAHEANHAAKENARANAAAEGARRASSSSTAQSKLRDSQRYALAAVKCQEKIASIEKAIAREQQRLNDAERRLSGAQQDDDRRRATAQARTEQAHSDSMRRISDRVRHHDKLHRVATLAIKRLEALPPKITVLFLASNPLDQAPLRLDEEVRGIEAMIRQSAYRDAVKLESRWAARPLDILQAINECDPHVIHFSGHGSTEEELAFQDNAGLTKLVSKEALVQTIAASSDHVQLVFFNVCYSHSQAKAVVQHVPAAIGMNTAIGDEAARVFAAQFYSAIGFGLSVAKAFAQAKAALMLEAIPEDLTPELFLTAGLDGNDLVLVRKGQPSESGERTVGLTTPESD